MDHELKSFLIFVITLAVVIAYFALRYTSIKRSNLKKAEKATKEDPFKVFRLNIRTTSFGEIKIETLGFNRYYLLRKKDNSDRNVDAPMYRILYVTVNKFYLDNKEYHIDEDLGLEKLSKSYSILELVI